MSFNPLLMSMSPAELRCTMQMMGCRTQQQLADKIGVTRSTVYLWLSGKGAVPRHIAMLLRMLSV